MNCKQDCVEDTSVSPRIVIVLRFDTRERNVCFVEPGLKRVAQFLVPAPTAGAGAGAGAGAAAGAAGAAGGGASDDTDVAAGAVSGLSRVRVSLGRVGEGVGAGCPPACWRPHAGVAPML